LDSKKRIFIGPDVIYKVSKLIYVYPPSPPTNFSQDSLLEIRNRYLSKFSINDSAKSKKLFLTRKPGLSRSLSNFEEVHDSLISNGVEIIDGSESLGVMVESFANASHIAAVHGSILANSFLVGSSCKFLEYCPENRPDFTFRNKLKLSSNYDHRLIKSDEGFNLNLNVSELLSFYNS
jgi:capsular polysaccharide biosynthesis protein